MCSAHQAENKGIYLKTLRRQTNRDRASRATTKLTSQLHLTCRTNREKNRGRVAGGFRQRTGENNLNRHGSQGNLIFTSRFVRAIPTLSHYSIGHGGRCEVRSFWDVHLNTPPQNGCREVSRFVHKAVNIILRRFIFYIVEDWQLLNCCNSLIPVILIDARVLQKLSGFFTRKCVTHHSCQLVEYCSWNVFRQQICNIFKRIPTCSVR